MDRDSSVDKYTLSTFHDWRYFVRFCREFYGHNAPYTNHKNRCVCEFHMGKFLPQEQRKQNRMVFPRAYDLQQFSTSYEHAGQIARLIRDKVGTGRNFIELGAGNGIIAANLAMLGFSGYAVEIDLSCNLGKLKAVEVELPFENTIPLKVLIDCIEQVRIDEIEADFVVMNPPFSWGTLDRFLNRALKLAKIVFVVLPTEKVPDTLGVNGKHLKKKLDKINYSVMPLDLLNYRLVKSRLWHTQNESELECQLCVIYPTPSDEDSAKYHDGKEEWLINMLQDILPPPSGNPLYIPDKEDETFILEEKVPMVELPSHLAHRKEDVITLEYVRSHRLENLQLRQHAWRVPCGAPVTAMHSKFVDGRRFLTVEYGDEDSSTMTVEVRTYDPFFVRCNMAHKDYGSLLRHNAVSGGTALSMARQNQSPTRTFGKDKLYADCNKLEGVFCMAFDRANMHKIDNVFEELIICDGIHYIRKSPEAFGAAKKSACTSSV